MKLVGWEDGKVVLKDSVRAGYEAPTLGWGGCDSVRVRAKSLEYPRGGVGGRNNYSR